MARPVTGCFTSPPGAKKKVSVPAEMGGDNPAPFCFTGPK